MYLVGDLNLNIIDYASNTKVKNFFNLIFQNGLIPVINKPTRVTKKNATAIDHIITNSFINCNLTTGIIKTDISDHFPNFLISEKSDIELYPDSTTFFKRYINDKSTQNFNNMIRLVTWDNFQKINCPNNLL